MPEPVRVRPKPSPCVVAQCKAIKHSLLCELTATGQVEVLQPWPEPGCLGPSLITEVAAVTQCQALQAGTAPSHSYQAHVCECWQ